MNIKILAFKIHNSDTFQDVQMITEKKTEHCAV